MSEPVQTDQDPGWYHVFNTGTSHHLVFGTRLCKQMFLAVLAEVSEELQVEIHAYCLLDNRFDLLLQTPRSRLGKTMKYIAGTYTQRYNRQSGSRGPLFRGRYRSVALATRHAPAISRYLHVLPALLDTEQADRLTCYRWSSCAFHVNPSRHPVPVWLQTGELQRILQQTSASPDYAAYFADGVDAATLQFYSASHRAGIFEPQPQQNAGCGRGRTRHSGPPVRPGKTPLSPDIIIQQVARSYNLPVGQITRAGCRDERLAPAMAMYLCRDLLDMPLRDLARRFHTSAYTDICLDIATLQRRRATDADLKNRLDRLQHQLRTGKFDSFMH